MIRVARPKQKLFSSICVSRRQSDAATRIQAPVWGFWGGLGHDLRVSLQAYARMRVARHKVDSMRRAARLLGCLLCIHAQRDLELPMIRRCDPAKPCSTRA